MVFDRRIVTQKKGIKEISNSNQNTLFGEKLKKIEQKVA